MAGIAISLGCIVNLRVGDIAGAVLFTFGLLTVVHYRLKLFTGTAGFVASWRDMGELVLILLGNIVGCTVVAGLTTIAAPALGEGAARIVDARLALNPLQVTILAAGCGFIMTTAVEFGRRGKFLPLLFGVPVFILSGFLHSIADAYYYVASLALSPQLLWCYLWVVIGNFIGCNAYRAFVNRKDLDC